MNTAQKSLSTQMLIVFGCLQLAASCGEEAISGGGAVNTFGLEPDGPPMVRQVVVLEQIQDGDRFLPMEGLAFGSHPKAENDDGQVSTAYIQQQRVRVVVDERLPPFLLEEAECADGVFERIPPGSTAETLLDCADWSPTLSDCTGLCNEHGGFIDGFIDGLPDSRRLFDFDEDPDSVEYGVSLVCDGVSVALDPLYSHFEQTGTQVMDPQRGLRGLGPAFVLVPLLGLRTNSTCGVSFRPEVVDIDGNRICAPEGGVIEAGCEDGDVSLIQFGTNPLKFFGSAPSDGATDISVGGASAVHLSFNAPISRDSFSAITLTGNQSPVGFTALSVLSEVHINLDAPFIAATEYELTISTELTDASGGPLGAPIVVRWTTVP